MKRLLAIGILVCISILCIRVITSQKLYPHGESGSFISQTAQEEINVEWLKNASYPINDGFIQLKNGEEIVTVTTTGDIEEETYATQEKRAELKQYAFGDIDGLDGQDAVAYIETTNPNDGLVSSYVFLILNAQHQQKMEYSRIPLLQRDEKMNRIDIHNTDIVFDTTVHNRWDSGGPSYHLIQTYRYINGELRRIIPLTENATSTPRILDQARFQNSAPTHELISPDGEWLFEGLKHVGQEPFSRGLQSYLQFTNLKGAGNRYVYLDWFERPEDNRHIDDTMERPLGWTADGTSVYTGTFERFNAGSSNPLPALNGYWQPTYSVTRLDLSGPTFNYGSQYTVTPYGGDTYHYQFGLVLDFLAKEDRALWFESSKIRSTNINDTDNYKQKPSSRLIYFSPLTSSSTVIAEWPYGDTHTVTSASLDRDTKMRRAAYVVHRDNRNDEVYLYEASTTSSVATTIKIDLAPYNKTLTQEYGIQEPYQLVMEHTAMNLPGGLFLMVIGANKKTAIMRFNFFHNTWSAESSATGALL